MEHTPHSSRHNLPRLSQMAAAWNTRGRRQAEDAGDGDCGENGFNLGGEADTAATVLSPCVHACCASCRCGVAGRRGAEEEAGPGAKPTSGRDIWSCVEAAVALGRRCHMAWPCLPPPPLGNRCRRRSPVMLQHHEWGIELLWMHRLPVSPRDAGGSCVGLDWGCALLLSLPSSSSPPHTSLPLRHHRYLDGNGLTSLPEGVFSNSTSLTGL